MSGYDRYIPPHKRVNSNVDKIKSNQNNVNKTNFNQSIKLKNTYIAPKKHCVYPRLNTHEKTKSKEMLKKRYGRNINYTPEYIKSEIRSTSISSFQINPVINKIKKAKSDQEILCILANNTCTPAVYVKSVQKLLRWRHYKTMNKVITLIKSKNNDIPIAVYSMQIISLCNNDKMHQAVSILQQIEKDANTKPTLCIFKNLLSGCKRRGDTKIASEIWSKMINQYNLTPTRDTYMSIIAVYANNSDYKECENKFAEVRKITNNNDMHKLGPICNSMLKVYGTCKNKQKLLEIQCFMNQNNIPFTIIEYTTLMRAYLMLDEYYKVFEIYHNVINDKFKPDTPLIGVVAATCIKVIKLYCQSDPKSTEIGKHLNILKISIPKQYPYLIDKQYKQMIFRGILWKHLNKWNSIHVYDTFNFLSNTFGYWSFDRSNKQNKIPMMNLHGLAHIVAKFVLRHIFCEERSNLIETKNVYLVTGKGTHRLNHSTDSIKGTIIHELNNWVPKIKTYLLENDGRIQLDSYDIMKFIQMHKCIHPSSKCFPVLTSRD